MTRAAVNLEGMPQIHFLDVTNRETAASRDAQVALVARRPDAVIAELVSFRHLTMPRHHDVRPSDVLLRRMRGTIAAAAERAPIDFADLLMTPGLGARIKCEPCY